MANLRAAITNRAGASCGRRGIMTQTVWSLMIVALLLNTESSAQSTNSALDAADAALETGRVEDGLRLAKLALDEAGAGESRERVHALRLLGRARLLLREPAEGHAALESADAIESKLGAQASDDRERMLVEIARLAAANWAQPEAGVRILQHLAATGRATQRAHPETDEQETANWDAYMQKYEAALFLKLTEKRSGETPTPRRTRSALQELARVSPDKARGVFAKASLVVETELGRESAELAPVLITLAGVAKGIGVSSDEVLPLLDRALRVATGSFGDHHPYVAQAYVFRGMILLESSKKYEAADSFLKWLVAEKELPPFGEGLFISSVDMTHQLMEAGDYQGATELFVRALEMQSRRGVQEPSLLGAAIVYTLIETGVEGPLVGFSNRSARWVQAAIRLIQIALYGEHRLIKESSKEYARLVEDLAV
jgi:hypothetical protein